VLTPSDVLQDTAARTSGPRRERGQLASLLIALLLAVWVQRRALGSFFGADDLIHLEQAYDILPTLFVPWRLLTQVLYFRMMAGLFGPAPAPYMLVNLLLHLLNVGLLFFLVRRLTARRSTALLAAGLFGAHPLHLEVLFRAVTINETATCACVLAAALCLSGRRSRGVLGTLLFLVGIFCKESILALPLALAYTSVLASGGWGAARRALPAGMIALAAAVAFFLLRSVGLAPTGGGYSVHVGANVFHNAMTYLVWAVDLVHPLPDLVRSFNTRAWPLAVTLLGLLLLFAVWGSQRRIVRWGLIWWASALFPVLILEHAAYGYYSYVSLAGLATAGAAALDMLLARLTAPFGVGGIERGGSARSSAGSRAARALPRVGPVVLPLILLLLFALRADWLQAERLRLPVPGTDLPLDPFLRSVEVARRAVITMGRSLPGGMTRAVVFAPEGTMSAFGARSGNEYPGISAGKRAYLFIEAVLDSGRALRLFYPQLDSIRFLREWSAPYRDWYLCVQVGNGYLENLGVGPAAHARYAQELLKAGFNQAARSYLVELLQAFPAEPPLRFLYSSALARTGDFRAARVQLEELIRVAPDDTLAARARRILATVPELQVR
jgi:hypothetical protein